MNRLLRVSAFFNPRRETHTHSLFFRVVAGAAVPSEDDGAEALRILGGTKEADVSPSFNDRLFHPTRRHRKHAFVRRETPTSAIHRYRYRAHLIRVAIAGLPAQMCGTNRETPRRAFNGLFPHQ